MNITQLDMGNTLHCVQFCPWNWLIYASYDTEEQSHQVLTFACTLVSYQLPIQRSHAHTHITGDTTS